MDCSATNGTLFSLCTVALKRLPSATGKSVTASTVTRRPAGMVSVVDAGAVPSSKASVTRTTAGLVPGLASSR